MKLSTHSELSSQLHSNDSKSAPSYKFVSGLLYNVNVIKYSIYYIIYSSVSILSIKFHNLFKTYLDVFPFFLRVCPVLIIIIVFISRNLKDYTVTDYLCR